MIIIQVLNNDSVVGIVIMYRMLPCPILQLFTSGNIVFLVFICLCIEFAIKVIISSGKLYVSIWKKVRKGNEESSIRMINIVCESITVNRGLVP